MVDNGNNPTAFVITHEPDPNRAKKSMSVIALSVTRSLGRHGINVVRVHPNRLDHSLESRYVREVLICPDMYESEEGLLEFLLDARKNYGGPVILIPASDDCAQFLGKYKPQLSKAFTICVADVDTMELVMNKRRQYEAATRANVPIPETYFPQSDADCEKIASAATNFPYIIKPLVAHTWRLAWMKRVSQGRKAIRAETAAELTAAYRSLGDTKSEVMIQEVIGGRDEFLFTFLGYFTSDSEPLAYCVRKKVRQAPLDFGYCTNTLTCHDQVVVDQAIRLLKEIRYSGIVGVEFKKDRDSGEYKLIEINARPVNTIGISTDCGVDIPWIAFCDLLGERIEPVTSWRDDVRWFRIWPDFFAAREQRRMTGAPSLTDWLRGLRGEGGDAIFSAHDLRMSLSYYSSLLWTAARRKFVRQNVA